MRAILCISMRFLRWVLEWVQNDPQIDLQIDPQIDLQTGSPDWSRDGPQIPIYPTSGNQWSRIGLNSCFIDDC